MKKCLSFLVAVSLLLGLVVLGVAEGQPIEITPFYSYTSSVTAGLSFSGNTANCNGVVDPSGTYSATVTVTLYKQNGSRWDYVNSWSGSSTNGNMASASGSQSVGSGTYKVTTTGNVGGGLEKPTKSITKTK